MKSLEDKIVKEGTVLEGNILKVGSFLNQQLDADFLMEMGKEISKIYEGSNATRILTIESSGIAVAFAAGAVMHLPVVFAKKHRSRNVSGDVYATTIHSFTHNEDYRVVVSCDFLKKDDRVIIVDDFLANGKAINGLIDLINQSGATLVGATCAIEKGFQGGGDELRSRGIRVESLAIIDEMDCEKGIKFRNV